MRMKMVLANSLSNCDWDEGVPRKPGRYLCSDGRLVEVMRYHGTFDNGPEWSGFSEIDPKFWMKLPPLPDEWD